jgi:Ser/Thr protein kinase RdoA (MazF antagonist)
MQENFYNLTPNQILEFVDGLGLDSTGHCFALNSLENRVYSVRLEDGSNLVVKFYRPKRWSKAQIQEEHDFLLDLQKEEVPVCAPISFDGNTIFEVDGIYSAIWNRTGGRSPEELTDEDLRMLGRFMARLHNVGASKEAKHRIQLTSQKYVVESLEYLNNKKFLPSSCKERYAKCCLEITRQYDLLIQDIPMIRIHGDCHKGNLLKGENGYFFLDFDDFLTGPAVQDIWMMLPPGDSEGLRQREILIGGYREFRDFEDSYFQLIEILRAMRYIYYSAWIARRWDDPSFPNAFPHFGTDEYWEKETVDLQMQLEIIYGNLDHPQVEKTETQEETLTNKDFFWDM